MIARLEGTLVSASPTCVVDVGGVGFELQIPEKDRALLPSAAGEVSFHTFLYVREDRLELFGFLRREDRELFTRLIHVSGIGPRTALGALADHPTERIVRAIKGGDHAFLCKLPGLGRKTAQRLTVELKDKLDGLEGEGAAEGEAPSLREEAIMALTTLGMARGAAEKALEKIDWQSEDASSLSSIVKQALKQVGSV